MTKEEFIQYFKEKGYHITDKQYYGENIIYNNLYLGDLTSIPEGFNPYMSGTLYLLSLTSIPEGFSPVVDGNLYFFRCYFKYITKF